MGENQASSSKEEQIKKALSMWRDNEETLRKLRQQKKLITRLETERDEEIQVYYPVPVNFEGLELVFPKLSSQQHREVITFLGGRCTCCGFNNIESKVFGRRFLQIDYVFGKKNPVYQDERIFQNLETYGKYFRVLCLPCSLCMKPGEPHCELHKWESLVLGTTFPVDMRKP